MAQILRDHFKTPKKHRGCHTQVEDKEKAAQQTLPEQSQPEAWSASPPKASTRFPPRSNAYLIIGLQNELTKCGILKNMSDDEDFWKLVQEEALGVGTKEKLQKIKLKLMNPRPWPPAASRRRETEMLVSSDQDSGARQGTQSLLARLTEWRKRCQQHGAAQRLHRGPEESKTMCKTRTDSQSKMYLSRLYRMYSTSLANMEFSRKLLERDGRFADMDAEHRARSLLDYMVPRERTQADVPPREAGEEDSPTPEQQPQAGPALRFLKCQSPETPQRRPHLKTGRHRVTLCGTSKLSEHERGTLAPARGTTDPRPTAPLTLAHVIQTHPVVEAKTASRYWVNNVDEE
uniref:Brachyury 2 n=1 Tax=Mus spicilegus TaxID=10103 RepID=A0A8C6N2T4_MUSSI